MTSLINTDGSSLTIEIPNEKLEALGLKNGALVRVSITENLLKLAPVYSEPLETLLEKSPKASFTLTDEDKQWLDG